jgi:outer membrane protein assembly factor BamD
MVLQVLGEDNLLKRCLLSFFCLFFIGGCSSEKKGLKNRTVESIYKNAVSLLKEGEYTEAATEFKDIDTLFPYSFKASEGQVLAAYSYFLASNYMDAIREIDVFLRYHPAHKLVAYAMYLRAMCIYMQTSSVGRESKVTMDAKQAFVELVNKFPDSIYYKDSIKRIIILDDIIAAHEMIIGRFYQKNKNALSAINRYNFVATQLPHTNYVPEAFYRIIECCNAVGLSEEAKSTYNVLISDYSGNVWSKKARLLKIK